MDPRIKDFGILVRKIRQQNKLSQEKLAEIAGLHRTYIGAIERGERNISLINILKIADALTVSPKMFFKGYGGPGFLGHENDVNNVFKEVVNGKECNSLRCSGRRA